MLMMEKEGGMPVILSCVVSFQSRMETVGWTGIPHSDLNS